GTHPNGAAPGPGHRACAGFEHDHLDAAVGRAGLVGLVTGRMRSRIGFSSIRWVAGSKGRTAIGVDLIRGDILRRALAAEMGPDAPDSWARSSGCGPCCWRGHLSAQSNQA